MPFFFLYQSVTFFFLKHFFPTKSRGKTAPFSAQSSRQLRARRPGIDISTEAGERARRGQWEHFFVFFNQKKCVFVCFSFLSWYLEKNLRLNVWLDLLFFLAFRHWHRWIFEDIVVYTGSGKWFLKWTPAYNYCLSDACWVLSSIAWKEADSKPFRWRCLKA